jgi:hypothetical protein
MHQPEVMQKVLQKKTTFLFQQIKRKTGEHQEHHAPWFLAFINVLLLIPVKVVIWRQVLP